MTYVACRGCGEMVGIHEAECHACGQPHPRHIEAPAVSRPGTRTFPPASSDEPGSGDCRRFDDREECA